MLLLDLGGLGIQQRHSAYLYNPLELSFCQFLDNYRRFCFVAKYVVNAFTSGLIGKLNFSSTFLIAPAGDLTSQSHLLAFVGKSFYSADAGVTCKLTTTTA